MKYILQGLRFLWKLITNPDVYRFTLRTLWLFFPSFIFLFLCWFAFWNISQGKDLMVYTIEHPMVFIFFFIAILFFAFTIWYSSRLVAKAKFWQNKYYLWLKLRVHMPRLLGFTSFTIIILAFLQLKIDESPQTSRGWAGILFILSIPYYFLLDYSSHYLVFVKNISGKALWLVIICLLAVCMLAIFTLNEFTGLIAMLVVMQIAMVVFFIFRRKSLLIETSGKYAEPPKDFDELKGLKFLLAGFRQLLNDPEEKSTFKIFNFIAVAAFIIYITAIARVDTAGFLGSFPFVFLAFGVLVGFINFVSTLSIFSRFNFHILFLAAAFIFGNLQEPHKVQLVKKENPSALFSKRQSLKEYFTHWVNERFKDSVAAGTKQPVYFILSDGGASRSGYWVASVLSRMEDSLGEKFSDNLFCLSGASGGSVGNAAFFNLLRFKKNRSKEFSSFQDESKAYLGSDFLSYTLARMLGPDFFRYVFFPFLNPVKDRAYALTTALEKASDDTTVLDNSFSVGMSSLITQTNQPSNLPIFCVNTTRMQDGTPAVISTVNMNERFFNKRVDVLDLLSEEEDIKLSSAVVLGASFPYVSPAGRIDKRRNILNKDSSIETYCEPHYFVDGGYFDNSGAGVVNEMIIAMRQMLDTDPYLKTYKDKLDFYVLHMTNDPYPGGDPVLNKVNPLVNDLAAPLQTLAGAYGSQTSVNDSRLKNYLLNNFSEGHYIPFNLYKSNDKMSFSMNWVISKRTLDSMNRRLDSSLAVATFISERKN
jgi:Patatin-like phospholipase